MVELRRLKVLYCTKLQQIPSDLSPLKELRELSIEQCHKLIEMPQIGQLQKLEKLILHGSETIRSVPSEVWSHSNVKIVRLSGFHSHTGLPPDIARLTELKELQIHYFRKLQELPAEIGKLSKLQVLCITTNYELLELPREIGLLKNLRFLNLFRCTKITSLPQEIGQLSNLKRVCLESCHGLSRLPHELLSRPKLQRIDIRECRKLKLSPQEIMAHLSFSVTGVTTKYESGNERMLEVYAGWNRAGRSLLKEQNAVPDGLWAMVLANVETNIYEMDTVNFGEMDDFICSIRFLFLREKPSLLQCVKGADRKKQQTQKDK